MLVRIIAVRWLFFLIVMTWRAFKRWPEWFITGIILYVVLYNWATWK